ncbi:MAG: phycobilisome rod-core linker polypeptide, partial [Cyanobacteria bacterium J06632_3]
TQGIQGFVDELLNSDEYLNNFGETTVPYQRRRILPQRAQGDITFEHMARYGTDYRDQLPEPSAGRGSSSGASNLNYLRWEWQKNPPAGLLSAWVGLFYAGMAGIVLLALITLLGL